MEFQRIVKKKKRENSRASLNSDKNNSQRALATKPSKNVIIMFSFEEGTPTLIKWLKPNRLPEKTKEERLLEGFLIPQIQDR